VPRDFEAVPRPLANAPAPAFTDLAAAYIEAMEHSVFRDRKYSPYIQELTVDDVNGDIKIVSNHTALTFAKLKHPEKFDDRSNLKMEY
jgi:hypothetical protein